MARAMDDFDNAGREDGDTDGQLDSAAIRADIRETRERMSQTLDGLSERLNPQVLKQQVRDEIEERKQAIKNNIREATIGRAQHMARDAAGRVTDTRRGIADAIRENPIPAAMVGIGLGWLLYNGRRHESYGETEMVYQPRADNFTPQEESPGMYNEPGRIDRAREWAGEATSGVRDRAQAITGRAAETVGDITERAQETVSGLMDRTTGMIGGTASRARSTASGLADTTRHRADTLETRFHDAVVENPLVVGAAAIALGLTAGLAVPSTRRESELMGAKRDELFNRARGMAEDATGRAQQVAQRVVEEAQDSAKEAVQTIKSTVSEAAQDLQTTAREAAQEQGFMSSGTGGTGGMETGTGTGAGNAFATTGTTKTTTGTTGTGAFSTGTEGGSIADPRQL